VPHITLKSIANNAEIDVIWEKWQQTLEPLRARLNAALGRDLTLPALARRAPPSPAGAGEGLATASNLPLARTAGEGADPRIAVRGEAGEGDAAGWEEWRIPREGRADWPAEAKKLHS
jgi:adenine-specific DNA-methyltransferase